MLYRAQPGEPWQPEVSDDCEALAASRAPLSEIEVFDGFIEHYCACGRRKSECDGSRKGCRPGLPGEHAVGACPCMSREEPGPSCNCECHRLPLPTIGRKR